MRLSIQDLSLTYGTRTAVDHVSFDVEAGEMVAIVGPNGSGKIDKITIESKEVSHTLTMEREMLDGESPDDEEELVTYRVDNKIVPEDPFKRFYQILVGLSVDTEKATEPTAPSEVTVTYYLNKGNIREVRLDFVPYDRDFYSIVRDGKSDFIIARNSVDNMLKELEALYNS